MGKSVGSGREIIAKSFFRAGDTMMKTANSSSWEFWIDVGGTFTDCIARSPDDRLVQCKVLSSGVTKGRISNVDGNAQITDAGRKSDPARFWIGYELRLLDAQGSPNFTARVTSFDAVGGTLSVAQPLPPGVSPGTAYELVSGEEAPLLAIRYVLVTKPKDWRRRSRNGLRSIRSWATSTPGPGIFASSSSACTTS